MAGTARYELALLEAGQASKEITHNEALLRVDALLHPVVEAADINVPPNAPNDGDCYLIGATPEGAFSGQAASLAVASEGGWRFIAPREGLAVRHRATGRLWEWRGGAWIDGVLEANRLSVWGQQVVGPRQAAIADPVGGATSDVEGRAAIAAILGALRTHGLISS